MKRGTKHMLLKTCNLRTYYKIKKSKSIKNNILKKIFISIDNKSYLDLKWKTAIPSDFLADSIKKKLPKKDLINAYLEQLYENKQKITDEFNFLLNKFHDIDELYIVSNNFTRNILVKFIYKEIIQGGKTTCQIC